MHNKIKIFVKQESVLFILFIMFIFLTALMPGYIPQYAVFIDWKTIITLLALIITATGIKESGYLDRIASRMLLKIHDERSLAFFMVFLSAGLSIFLTNDITLFIVVPLTLCMQSVLKKDLVKLVIFEALAVNAGSALTPIGNPQNIFLWNMWGNTFFDFMINMAPIVLIMTAVLAVFIVIVFKNHKLNIDKNILENSVNNKLGLLSFVIMVMFIISLQVKMELYILPLIILIYMFFYGKVLANVDWFLILIFVFMFIDFSLISRIPQIQNMILQIDMKQPGNVFIMSALLSQIMSNVPAAIFMSKFSDNWKIITFGVDIAGNGFIIGSLANLIAMRLLKSKDTGVWFDFHKYSVPFFLLTGLAVWMLLK